jgi:cobalt-zinc-cadmium efflux system protein
VDPICTLISALLVLSTTFGVLLSATRVFMGSVPAHVDVLALRSALAGVDGVVSVHDLHLWELVPGEPLASVHVVIDAEHGAEGRWYEVLSQCNRAFSKVGFAHSTVQIEALGSGCATSCN